MSAGIHGVPPDIPVRVYKAVPGLSVYSSLWILVPSSNTHRLGGLLSHNHRVGLGGVSARDPSGSRRSRAPRSWTPVSASAYRVRGYRHARTMDHATAPHMVMGESAPHAGSPSMVRCSSDGVASHGWLPRWPPWDIPSLSWAPSAASMETGVSRRRLAATGRSWCGCTRRTIGHTLQQNASYQATNSSLR